MSAQTAAKIAAQRRPTKDPDAAGDRATMARRRKGSAPGRRLRAASGGRDKAMIPTKKTVLPASGGTDVAVNSAPRTKLPSDLKSRGPARAY